MLLGTLEKTIRDGQKNIINREQPKTLYSTGDQVDRDEVIAARETHSRGLKTKNVPVSLIFFYNLP